MFEYYAYSISHGQESACGGRVRPHSLAVSVLNNHEQMTHTTSPETLIIFSKVACAYGLPPTHGRDRWGQPHVIPVFTELLCEKGESSCG